MDALLIAAPRTESPPGSSAPGTAPRQPGRASGGEPRARPRALPAATSVPPLCHKVTTGAATLLAGARGVGHPAQHVPAPCTPVPPSHCPTHIPSSPVSPQCSPHLSPWRCCADITPRWPSRALCYFPWPGTFVPPRGCWHRAQRGPQVLHTAWPQAEPASQPQPHENPPGATPQPTQAPCAPSPKPHVPKQMAHVPPNPTSPGLATVGHTHNPTQQLPG